MAGTDELAEKRQHSQAGPALGKGAGPGGREATGIREQTDVAADRVGRHQGKTDASGL